MRSLPKSQPISRKYSRQSTRFGRSLSHSLARSHSRLIISIDTYVRCKESSAIIPSESPRSLSSDGSRHVALARDVPLQAQREQVRWMGYHRRSHDRRRHSYTDLRECTIVWAVNVPGENTWYSKEVDGIVQAERPEKSYELPLPHKFPVPGAPHVGVQLKVSHP
jgi:hypothetical protein